MVLPTADIYSDVSLVVLLFSLDLESGEWFKRGTKTFAIKMGRIMTIPLILSTLFILPHWLKCERTLKRRIITFPLLLLQLYPQYRSMRILWWAFVRKNATKALNEKHHHESSLSNVGKCSGKHTYIIRTYIFYAIFIIFFRSIRGKCDSSSFVFPSNCISLYD